MTQSYIGGLLAQPAGPARIVAQLVAVGGRGRCSTSSGSTSATTSGARGSAPISSFLISPSGSGSPDPISARARRSGPLWNGVRNTLALAVVGLPLLTLIGVLVGVGRLSTNWLVAKVSALLRRDDSESAAAVADHLRFSGGGPPAPSRPSPTTPFGWFVISNLEIYVPGIRAGTELSTFMLIMVSLPW